MPRMTTGTDHVPHTWSDSTSFGFTVTDDAWLWWHSDATDNITWGPSTTATASSNTPPARTRRRTHPSSVVRANERARQLLIEHLDDEQREQYERFDCFLVTTRDGRRFIIAADFTRDNVLELSGSGAALRCRNHCGHIGPQYPLPDNALTQKLMLDADPDAFVRRANSRAWWTFDEVGTRSRMWDLLVHLYFDAE